VAGARGKVAPRGNARTLADLVSVGPATLGDFSLIGIHGVADLVHADAHDLYDRICVATQARHDPCCEDVFAAAIAQARDPDLPEAMCKWPYWSGVRKSRRS
jgi:hypothetical protein